jgi:prepilin-type N-terminal cleavage/methylation domain-containing protein
MKHVRSVRFGAAKGFTLIESIIVMVVLGIAAAAIISLQGNIFKGQADNAAAETGVQMTQQCAEQILATRWNAASGYSSVTTSTCSALGSYSVAVTPTYPSGTSAFGCGTGITCCDKNSSTCLVSISFGGLNPIYLKLVNY